MGGVDWLRFITPAFSMKSSVEAWRAYRRSMILLITPSARGQECAATLKEATGNETHWRKTYSKPWPGCGSKLTRLWLSTNSFWKMTRRKRPGIGAPGYGISGIYQLRGQRDGALWSGKFAPRLQRRKSEETQARRSVEQQFRSENGVESLTSMLLSCELAIVGSWHTGPAAEKNVAPSIIWRAR